MKKKYIIYTDGGCKPNPGPGGFGIIILDDNNTELFRLSGGEILTTNNRMEYLGAIQAIKKIETIELNMVDCDILIHTDSNLLVQTYTTWMKTWKKNNWKKNGSSPEIKNLDLVQELYEFSVKYPQISFVWVKGHAGNKYNEIVDQIATAVREKIENSNT